MGRGGEEVVGVEEGRGEGEGGAEGTVGGWRREERNLEGKVIGVREGRERRRSQK